MACVVDTETTIYAKGNPFSRRNRLIYVGAYVEGGNIYVGTPDILPTLRREAFHSSPVVMFNGKFDLHWLRRAGTILSDRSIWDVQLAHFLFSSQRDRYPSLQQVCDHYGIKGKLDVVERDYWSKGIDTPDIPQGLMLEYLTQDLVCTMQCYQAQREEFKGRENLFNLFTLQCQDLLVLEEMEWNGLKLDVAKCREKAEKIHQNLQSIDEKLRGFARDCPVNWDSGDHISCVLYGGTITIPYKEVAGIYKTGEKVGQPRYKWNERVYVFPRLVEPLDGSELKKEGYFSSDDSVLRQVRDKSGLVALLLERAKLSKSLDYFEGLPDLIEKMDWEPGVLHGQLNQCVARTGRLSAEKPNQQNFTDEIKQLIAGRL